MIARSDAEAEALIGRVRMFVGGVLCVAVTAVLFRLPTETFALRQTELYAALVVTLLYFLLGLASYRVARLPSYRPWHGFAFAMLEVALVLANIYFDIQDGQTNSLFALASPLILMLALVLVLQVLRYRLFVHAVVSLTLIAGVLFLLFLDVKMPLDPPPLVVGELLQMYSLPPNMVRLLMLAVLATIVGLAIMRSRRLMESIAHELEESHNRNRFLPRELKTKMSDYDVQTLREGSERDLVIMFVDVRGFTELSSQMRPAETAAMLSAYRWLVTDAVLAQGGIVDKFIGDGVLCVFGLESTFDTAVRAALAAGNDIFVRLASWNSQRSASGDEPLAVVIAVHGGPVLAAAIGDDRRLEFTVTGPAVNTASRMEGWAKENDEAFVVSGAVAMAVGDTSKAARMHPLGSQQLRGDADAIDLLAMDIGAHNPGP